MRSYTLLSWYLSPVRGSVYGACHVQRITTRDGVSDMYLEPCDVTVVAGRQERGRCFDRGVCERGKT